MVHGFCTSIGVKVTRGRGRRERTDYLTPNVGYVWEHSVSGQREFRNIDIKLEEAHKWVREQISDGTLQYFKTTSKDGGSIRFQLQNKGRDSIKKKKKKKLDYMDRRSHQSFKCSWKIKFLFMSR